MKQRALLIGINDYFVLSSLVFKYARPLHLPGFSGSSPV